MTEQDSKKTIEIPFGDGQWAVTPNFHAMVGPITKSQFKVAWSSWKTYFQTEGGDKPMYVLPTGDQVFTYVTDKARLINDLRSKWAGRNLLFFTNDPLIINELRPEEVTLACMEGDRLVLTNFKDLPEISDGLKAYKLGEYWVSFAEGGSEEELRFVKSARTHFWRDPGTGEIRHHTEKVKVP